MKKAFLFSLGLVVAFSSLFISCVEDDGLTVYTVSVSSDDNGSASIKDNEATSLSVTQGNSITVVATPDEGYQFFGWFVGDSNVPVSTDAIFTFTASKDIALLAKFEKSFSVSVRSAGNGKVSFKDIEETSLNNVLIGTELTIEAVADANCDFIGWFVGNSNEPVSTDATYTFTVSENVALVAKFNKWPLVSISSGGNGSVSFENSSELSQYVQPSEEVTIVATPDENSDFVGWYVDDSNEPVSTDATYIFTVAENVTLVAKFNKWPLVSISSGANGTVSFENSSELSQYIQIGEEVTVVATPNEKCEFLGWFVGNSNEPVSTEATYTFTVSENVALVAKFEKIRTYLNDYEYVDLGLSVKWAAYNVGATKPEEYGGYYAWGETEEKSNYSWETYKWCNGSYDTMTKYCTSSYGTVDNKTTLDPEDDVAHVKWGGDWRMPTTEEQRELLNNSTWQWTTLNGVNGYKVTGPNGNCIFLPAAGYRVGTDVDGRGNSGYYWSGSLNSYYSYYAYILYFSGYYYHWDYYNRYYGLSVRPVCK